MLGTYEFEVIVVESIERRKANDSLFVETR